MKETQQGNPLLQPTQHPCPLSPTCQKVGWKKSQTPLLWHRFCSFQSQLKPFGWSAVCQYLSCHCLNAVECVSSQVANWLLSTLGHALFHYYINCSFIKKKASVVKQYNWIFDWLVFSTLFRNVPRRRNSLYISVAVMQMQYLGGQSNIFIWWTYLYNSLWSRVIAYIFWVKMRQSENFVITHIHLQERARPFFPLKVVSIDHNCSNNCRACG